MQEEIEHKTVNFAISTTKLFLPAPCCAGCSFCCGSMKRLVRQKTAA